MQRNYYDGRKYILELYRQFFFRCISESEILLTNIISECINYSRPLNVIIQTIYTNKTVHLWFQNFGENELLVSIWTLKFSIERNLAQLLTLCDSHYRSLLNIQRIGE